MGQITRESRLVLTPTAAPTVAPMVAPAIPAVPASLRPLRSAWAGWSSGILVFVALGFSCVDLLPWSVAILPLTLLAGFLALRSVEEWPRVGFPACVLGVGLLVVSSGLFRAGIGWAGVWEDLHHAGGLASGPGMMPVLGKALAVLLGGSFLAVLFLYGDVVWRTLSSIRLAVVTLSSIGILSVIGTMVVQRFGAGALPGPEREFVEKFMKGQGAIPVNARFMVSPPKVQLTKAETEQADLMGKAFGAGKARQRKMGYEEMHARSEKAMAIEAHVKERRDHLLRLFERLDTLGFTNVFRTWWFNSLLVLLFLQVTAVIARRYPWGWANSGWVMTHVGVLTVLVGCVISDGLLKDGSLALTPGESADRFQEYTRLDALGKPVESELGYHVRMLGTDQSFYHELQIAFPRVRAGEDVLWTQEQLRAGRILPVEDPSGDASYEIRILESHERAYAGAEMVSAAKAGRTGGVPVVRVSFLAAGAAHGGAEHVMDGGYLFTDGFYSGRLPAYLVRYRRAETAEEARDLVAGKGLEGKGRHGTLRVRVPEISEPIVVPATPGETVRAAAPEGTQWSFEVVRFHPTHKVGKAAAGEDPDAPAMNPVLEIAVHRAAPGEEAAKASNIVYADPALQAQWAGMMGRSGHGGGLGSGPAAACTYEFDYVAANGAWVVEGPGIERTLVLLHRDAAPEARPFAVPGTAVPLGGAGLAVRLDEAIPDAIQDFRVEPLPPESDEEYLAACLKAVESGVEPPPTVAAAKIEVREKDARGERTRTEWLVAERAGVSEGKTFLSSDGRLFLGMAETQSAMMFRSALEVQTLDGKPILEDGRPYRRVVRVNHPLDFGGYAFYQNNFIPEVPPSRNDPGRPVASVFRVKYDRGIPTIYTGFAVLSLGVCGLLYVDPMMKRRRKARGEKPIGEVSHA